MIPSFLASELEESNYNTARVVILPCPYEATTSYYKGTKEGPAALLAASTQLECFDSELEKDISKIGIYTLPEIKFGKENAVTKLDRIYQAAKKEIAAKKWLLTIGGEHTITTPLIKAHQDTLSEPIGFIHLDAHFDLRSSYENNPLSHACVLYRVREVIKETLSIGIRAFSEEEFQYAQKNKIPFITDKMLFEQNGFDSTILDQLPLSVYVSIDLDFFSPAEIPGVGTPVPGGVLWWQGLEIIKTIFKTKKVVGLDMVELCPKVEKYRSPFTAAMLAYKCIGYQFFL